MPDMDLQNNISNRIKNTKRNSLNAMHNIKAFEVFVFEAVFLLVFNKNKKKTKIKEQKK